MAAHWSPHISPFVYWEHVFQFIGQPVGVLDADDDGGGHTAEEQSIGIVLALPAEHSFRQLPGAIPQLVLLHQSAQASYVVVTGAGDLVHQAGAGPGAAAGEVAASCAVCDHLCAGGAVRGWNDLPAAASCAAAPECVAAKLATRGCIGRETVGTKLRPNAKSRYNCDSTGPKGQAGLNVVTLSLRWLSVHRNGEPHAHARAEGDTVDMDHVTRLGCCYQNGWDIFTARRMCETCEILTLKRKLHGRQP